MLDRLRGAFIGSICGIAAPESFEGALKISAPTSTCCAHLSPLYTEAEFAASSNRCIRRDLAVTLPRKKDAVRMPRLPEADMKVPIYFMRVEIESSRPRPGALVTRICKPQPMLFAERILA